MELSLPSTLQKAYDIIFKSGANGVTVDELSIELFGPKIGLNPEKIDNARVTVCLLRKRLKPFGMVIPTSKITHRDRIEIAW